MVAWPAGTSRFRVAATERQPADHARPLADANTGTVVRCVPARARSSRSRGHASAVRFV